MIETLIGLGCLLLFPLILKAYIRFCQISDEDTDRGRIARIIGKIGSGIFLFYIAFVSIIVLILGLIALFCS